MQQADVCPTQPEKNSYNTGFICYPLTLGVALGAVVVEKPRYAGYSKPGIIMYLVLVQAFSMFATDMYTPALPTMAGYFDTTDALVNMTVAGFFAFQLVSMLIFGPISDKIGRKPILLLACAVFVIMSLGAMLATSIWVFMTFRVFEAIAAGMGTVVGMAVVRDCFEGRVRENVLLWMQGIFVLGPIAAPLLGGLLLTAFDWRATFVALALLGIIPLLMTLRFKESLPPEMRAEDGLAQSFKGLISVLHNKSFSFFMIATLFFGALPFTAYIMTAAYIYEVGFGFSPQWYSYMFGLTAAISILGIPLYKLVEDRVNLRYLSLFIFFMFGAMGVIIVLFAHNNVWLFFTCIVMIQICGTMFRPYSTNILLGMCARNVGAASSMINCSFTVVGLIGTIPMLALTSGHALGMGWLYVVGCIITLILWFIMMRTDVIIPGIKDN